MSEKDLSINADSPEHIEPEVQPLEEAQAKKRRFVEPKISVPVDVFEATTFFLFATNDVEDFG
jgi:hypothetical protein